MARQASALARRELRLCASNIYALQACRLSAQVAQQVLSLLAFTNPKVQILTLKAFFFFAVCSTPASPMFRRSSGSKWKLSRNSASWPPAPTPPLQVRICYIYSSMSYTAMSYSSDCPHTAVLMLLYICPHTAVCLSSYCCLSVPILLSSYCCISVLILLYICPHTTIPVSTYRHLSSY